MRIVCVGYRDWALKIYDKLAQEFDYNFLIIRNKNQYNDLVIRDFKPDYILFYGWSWIIKSDILRDFKCLMLHPSPLPLYRGGSPIQNQIIDGIEESMVTIFKMNDQIDAGPIFFQKEYSLEGTLQDIFERISNIGYELTTKIFIENTIPIIQNHKDATYCKRRKPEESEITIDELQSKPAKYLYNKVRMLTDPYPNAFIKTIDGKKILIKSVEIEE